MVNRVIHKNMNYVSVPWLRRIRLALAGYALVVALLLGGTGFLLNTPDIQTMLVPFAAALAAYLLYEMVSSVWLVKKHAWLACFFSFLAALGMTSMAILLTGLDESFFAVGLFLLVFIAPALSLFIAPLILLLMSLGLGLVFTQILAADLLIQNSVGIVIICLIMAVIGSLFWRRYYRDENSSIDTLSSSLSKEQAKSDIIINAIEDGVMLIDNRKTIRLFNPSAAKITGWPAKEALGLDCHSVLRLVDDKNQSYSSEQSPFNRVFKEAKPVRDNNAMLITHSNKQIYLDVSLSPLYDQRRNITGAVGIFRDVSQERQEEQQRAEFISTASHEMRTPVAAIEGYLALAMNEHVSKIDSKARSYLEKAHASTQHLGRLFQDLLTSAKAEDGRISNHPSVIEIGEFLEKLTDDLKFTAEKKNLGMEFVVGSSDQLIDARSQNNSRMVKPLYYTYADPERLREVITNLFDNAVKYTETGKISVGLTGNNEVVQMYIKDTGPGIPAEDIPHLFQKFYRVDNSATRTIGGTGLGLFICRKIIELYNGRIWVESEVDKGSSFFINLPRLSSQKASQLKIQETGAPQPMSTLGGS